jgi:hypothetical protein
MHSYHDFIPDAQNFDSSPSQHSNPSILKGDIFALQLRGHFAFG